MMYACTKPFPTKTKREKKDQAKTFQSNKEKGIKGSRPYD